MALWLFIQVEIFKQQQCSFISSYLGVCCTDNFHTTMATIEEGGSIETKKEINPDIDVVTAEVMDGTEMIHVMTTGSSGSVTLPLTLTQSGLVSLTSSGQSVSN